jgi:fucose 4-O-acetylase-like acetyltransferase
MMLLGIYLHSVVAYATVGGWPYKQPEQTWALNSTLALIHVFRMPVFYAMAGFFSALLYRRHGFRAAADNRARRILIPFVVGWCIIFPIVGQLGEWGRWGMPPTFEDFASRFIPQYLHPLHLWFLEYLLLLYALAGFGLAPYRSLRPLG